MIQTVKLEQSQNEQEKKEGTSEAATWRKETPEEKICFMKKWPHADDNLEIKPSARLIGKITIINP